MLQLLGLFSVIDDEGVKVSAASDLEFGHIVLVLLYLDRLGVLSARGQEKILDFFNFLGHYSCTFLLRYKSWSEHMGWMETMKGKC